MSSIDEIISALPQASAIKSGDAKRWVAGVLRYHTDRAEWHADRLKGFGGSEIGPILRHYLSRTDGGFQTIAEVVESKLLRRLPTRETIHTKRGTVLEDLARLAFLFRYAASQDTAALNDFYKTQKKEGADWLVGNPDDFVNISGRRFLADYKVPNTYSAEIEFDYVAQLHHYYLGARMRGIHVDGLICAKLDIAPELANSLVERISDMPRNELIDMAKMIAKVDMPGLRVVGHVVDLNRDMLIDILDCGSDCWQSNVMQGVVPKLICEPLAELSADDLLQIEKYQLRYALAKAGIGQLEAIAVAANKSITDALSGVDIEGKAMPLAVVKVEPQKGYESTRVIAEAIQLGAAEEDISVQSKDYSIPALIEEIRRLKGDPEAEHLYQPAKLDEGLAIGYLKNLGADIDAFKKKGLRIAISIKKEDRVTSTEYAESSKVVIEDWMAGYEKNTGRPDAEQEVLSDASEDIGFAFKQEPQNVVKIPGASPR